MMKILRTLMATAALTSALAANALALSSSKAEKFIASLPAVQEIAEGMNADDKAFLSQESQQAMQRLQSGEAFSPYSSNLDTLKSRYPAEYKQLDGITDEHGFSSPADWAETGDDVMLTYMALQADSNPGMMQQLDPATVQMMPPSMQEKMKGVMAMMQRLQDVPDSDKAALKPHVAALEQWMSSNTGNQ